MLVHSTPRLAYEVEFIDASGATRALATVTPEQIAATAPSGSSHRAAPA